MSTMYGFELLEVREIPELRTTARLYRHVATGARLLSLENGDENKVFGITFRTPPPDSTGLPHIMEHSVLCGSEKYPVKEPFVELMKGSLSTFLNAMTYPDKTCYPVASQNLQDFYNLMDVYVDAVFHPLITPETFQQEGWHYELESLDAPLRYKGVVFNEMKGAYSSPEDLIYDRSRMVLFPDTPYGLDSGGDPDVIPQLTYAQFKAFHEAYYHPSNAFIFFAGDDPPEERLRRMQAYLEGYEARRVESELPLQPRFTTPRRASFPYPVSEEGGRAYVTVNWLLPENNDAMRTLSWEILAHILVGTPASPLRKALIDSGLGEEVIGVGLDDELRQLYFSTGLKGVAPQETERVESLVLETLAALVAHGLDAGMVEASVNTVEFRLREQNYGRFPRGLVQMLRSLTMWLHDGDPFAPLAFDAPLRAIKGRLAAEGGAYFTAMIREHLLENAHRVTVTLEPDPTLARRQAEAEAARLAEARAAMSEAALRAVVEQTRRLRELQERPDPPEALATIPRLSLEDLEREVRRVPTAVEEMEGVTVLTHDLATNGILYLDVGFDLHHLPQSLLPYAGLFGDLLLEMGTEEEDFVRLTQRIGRKTGGIRAETFSEMVRGQGRAAVWLFLRGKATVEQATDLLAILRDILLTARLDQPERFLQIVLERKARAEAMLIPMGHRVVVRRLLSAFDEAHWADEQMAGVSYLFFLRRLAEEARTAWSAVLERLEQVRAALINRAAMLCNVTVEAGAWAKVRPQLGELLGDVPLVPAEAVVWTPAYVRTSEGLTIPAKVNYVAKGANLYALGYSGHGSAEVVVNHLRAAWLWEKVRVQGGAYGGLCGFNPHAGTFYYASYRDPNLIATLDVYDRTPHHLRTLRLSDEERIKNIIGAIGTLDAYQLPDARGFSAMTRYLIGYDDEARQQYRDEVLGTTPAHFHAFGEVLEAARRAGRVVVLGAAEALRAANAELEEGLSLTAVM